MLNAFASPKCSKKCQHNVQKPRSGPILAVLIHSLYPSECYLQSETKIEPDLRLGRECPTAVMPLGYLNFKKVIFRNYTDHVETVSGKLVDLLLVQHIVQPPMQPSLCFVICSFSQRSKNIPRHKNMCEKILVLVIFFMYGISTLSIIESF